MRRVNNLIALLIAISWCAGVIAPSSFAKPSFSKQEIDAISDSFADCVVKTKTRQARDFVGNNLPAEVILKRYGSLTDGDCLVKALAGRDGAEMSFPDPHFRYALARALVRFDYPVNSFENFQNVPLLEHPTYVPPVEADLPRNKRKADAIRANYDRLEFTAAMARFSECVARANPEFAQTFIVSKTETPDRDAAIKQIKPILGLCLTKGTIKFNAFDLIGALAVSYYRLAYQASPPATKTLKNGTKS